MLAELLIGCKRLSFQMLGLVEHALLPVLVTQLPLRGASPPIVYSRYSPLEHRRRRYRSAVLPILRQYWLCPTQILALLNERYRHNTSPSSGLESPDEQPHSFWWQPDGGLQ